MPGKLQNTMGSVKNAERRHDNMYNVRRYNF